MKIFVLIITIFIFLNSIRYSIYEINVNKNEDDRYNDKEVEDRFFEKIG